MGWWEEVAHTADLALHVWGDTLEDLFRASAAGMATLSGTSVAGVARTIRQIELTAPDAEALLVDWLNELLYLEDLTQSLFTGFAFETLSDTHLRATISGYPIAEHRAYIKAATFHNLVIERGPIGCETLIVFDV